MMARFVHADGLGDLVMKVEQIEVTMGIPHIDETWRFTDAAGHEHYFANHGYPTLRRVVDSSRTYYCGDCSEHHTDEASHYECLQCDETVKPGIAGPDAFRRFAPGRRSYTLNGEPISGERAKEIIEARRQR